MTESTVTTTENSTQNTSGCQCQQTQDTTQQSGNCTCQQADCQGCSTSARYMFNLCCPGDYNIRLDDGCCGETGGGETGGGETGGGETGGGETGGGETGGGETGGGETGGGETGGGETGGGETGGGTTGCDPSQYPALYYGNQLRRAGYTEAFTAVEQDPQGRLFVLGTQQGKDSSNRVISDAVIYRYSKDFNKVEQLTLEGSYGAAGSDVTSIAFLDNRIYMAVVNHGYRQILVLNDQLELLSKHDVFLGHSHAQSLSITAWQGALYISTSREIARVDADLNIQSKRYIGQHGHQMIVNENGIYLLLRAFSNSDIPTVCYLDHNFEIQSQQRLRDIRARYMEVAPDGAVWFVGRDQYMRFEPDLSSWQSQAISYDPLARTTPDYRTIHFACNGDALITGRLGTTANGYDTQILRVGADLEMTQAWHLPGNTMLTDGVRTDTGSIVWVGEQNAMESGRLFNDNFALADNSVIAEPLRSDSFEYRTTSPGVSNETNNVGDGTMRFAEPTTEASLTLAEYDCSAMKRTV